MKFIYLDTETTGLNPGQICELSMIIENEGKVIPLNYFFKVKEMEEGAQKVHGFSIKDLENLSNGLEFKDRTEEIYNLIFDGVLIAHNLPFDEKFISSELWRSGISFKPAGRLDTMEYFKPILKIPARSKKYGPYKNPKLSEVIDYFSVNKNRLEEYTGKLFGNINTTYHDSRFDTTAMYVAVNLQREILNGGDTWHKEFCH